MTRALSKLDIAHEMAARQRDISVSEFFLKNRHLLGFDSPTKAALTSVKEAVDNALDACEEAGILPEIWVEVSNLSSNALLVAVEDNGPGIVEEQLSRIFGKLLYGSKFHKLSQSRGQQGMGISAVGMYSQLTTGKPLHVLSRIQGEATATELLVSINTAKNRPEVHRKKRVDWKPMHGTRVEAQLEGHYQPRGGHSIGMYLMQTAIANPHVTIHFRDPHGEHVVHERSTAELPSRPLDVSPHPQGIELGQLVQMLSNTRCRTLLQFLEQEFSRVGRKTALDIIRRADQKLTERSSPKRIAHRQSQALHQALRAARVSAPRTDCLVPIGEERLSEGLRHEIDAAFYTVTTRPPAVYRGNPYRIEVGLAYGRTGGLHLEMDATGRIQKTPQHQLARSLRDLDFANDQPVHLLRFANRVPLLYDQEGCAITKAVTQTNWRGYGLQQTKGAWPLGPLVILVHMASVWVPFTSEAKEAIAPYPEVVKEIRLGLQQCGRRLAAHLRREHHIQEEFEKRGRIQKYLPHVGLALQQMLALSDAERIHAIEKLDDILRETRSPR